MLCLSRKDIEVIGEAALMDCAMANVKIFSIPLNLEWFAHRYLELCVAYRGLSRDGSVLGLTVYRGMRVELPPGGADHEISAPEDTIFLDETLLAPEKVHLMRFTLAHECAHQIIARVEEQRTGYSFCRRFEPGKRYGYSEVKNAEDWREWQSNALAAVLLMPKSAIMPHLTHRGVLRKLTSYDGRFNTPDYEKIRALSKSLNVSADAVKIRLKDIGYTVIKPESEFTDPYDIMAE